MSRAIAPCLNYFGWIVLFLALVSSSLGQTASDWQVPEATIRFDLSITASPSHPSAGLFVEIPDGGLLPGPIPLTQVFTANGKPVASYTLWHSPGRSLAVVIADPGGTGNLSVYVQPSNRYQLWTPNSGLTPSAILTADPTTGTMDAAKALASLGRVSPSIHYINKAGVQKAPLSIAGDESGRPRPASFYMLAHVVSRDPGRTWISPMPAAGISSEVRVNGSVISLQKRIDKWGGTGSWADIKAGPNRVEIFLAAPGNKPFFADGNNGLIYLTWRTPNASMDELGGVRSDAVPMTGTSRMETRIIQDREIMKSGGGVLRGAQMKDGRTAALIRFDDPKVYWFGNEIPLLAYRFQSIVDRNNKADKFTWQVGNGTNVVGASIEWILPGFQEQQVRLTTTSTIGQTSTVKPFFANSTSKTSLESEADRATFRRGFMTMMQAFPSGDPAVANLDNAYWRMLLRTVEFGKGTPLLRELFRKHSQILEARVSGPEREALQDIFLDVVGRNNPNEGFEWIRTFAKTTESQRRKDELIIHAAEIYMYYLRDYESADKLLRNLFRSELDDGQRILRIRLGDLALLKGDLNTATRYYAEVQNYTRIRRSLPARKDAPKAERGQVTGRPIIGASMEQAGTDDWKLRALVDASASEAVRSLLNQGHLLEARELLRTWERDLPLSKISADYIVLESTLYNAVNDSKRAASMLYAFCETVESSNYIPQAAPLLLNLMIDAGEAPDRIRDIGERLKKRLEFHPVAEQLERIMLLIPEKQQTKEVSADEE